MHPLLAQDYQRFKEASLGEQTLRLSCATFWVFAYWNLVRDWIVSGAAGSTTWAWITIVMTGLSGLVIGVLLTMRYSTRVVVCLLPFGFAACLLTVPQTEAIRVLYIPLAACALLIVVRTIVWSANTINRM